MAACEISETVLERAAFEHGLLFFGATPASALSENEFDRLREWCRAGYAGSMEYMCRTPQVRSDPRKIEPRTATVLSFAIPYATPKKEALREGHGRVARYALGRDYHRVIRKRLDRLGRSLLQSKREHLWRPVADSFPLLERGFGASAGLGFVGKNTMLIRQRLGSFFFLGEVLTECTVQRGALPYLTLLSDKERGDPRADRGRCGSCTRCLSGCPTGAFVAPHVMDARKCISYLTIEKKEAFTEWESRALGEWVFGCDICQEVCPFNHRRLTEESFSVWEEFSGRTPPMLPLLPLFLLRDDEAFRHRFQGTPFMRPGRVGLLRNALSVLLNTGAELLLREAFDLLTDERDPVLRAAVSGARKRSALKNQ
ncbi:tRNA epoxyqueuosine(34) reductase QueG [bacterium]|nr:tRNA epoxyqueuosine(34) reductase QueG [bacterium]